MLLVLPSAECRSLVRRSEEAVAPATGYLPAAEEDYEDLPGYSADGLSLPGYGDAAEVARDSSEGLATTITNLETTTSQAGGEIATTITDGGDKEGAGLYPANYDHSGIVTTDPSVEAAEETEEPSEEAGEETEQATEEAGEETEEATEETDDAGDDSESPFSLYSHLSPRIRECPGSSMEVCVTACPPLPSARVYGACVQGCADRCPASP